ncbi:DUF4190 domain-containing protein [Fonticella tunisiensis]|uniref:Uncharacterized protein DUF4190 n=1 Tax=Fonticella tunisiensis TaxID=1096341 RepID=A0A4R7KQF4_9CLOT|nr:DUF4190 domain-containing protein [Fonticella tunisiensis]TDT60914.1 uncharacterized protein DUF4190 [Fonticella tunisiensis]
MKNEGTAIASMVLGIVAIVLSIIPGLYWVGLACAIVGLILGINAKKKINESNGTLGGAGMATTGVVLSIISLALFVIALIACSAFISAVTSSI